MGQRPPAEPAEAEDRPARRRRSLPWAASNSRVAASASATIAPSARSRIAHRDVDRVAVRGDQLHAEREAALVDQPPDPVERDVERLAAHRLPASARRASPASGGGAKLDASISPSSSVGPPRQLLGQRRRMGEDQRQQVGQLRPGLEQAVEVHPARQPLDDVAEAVERADRVGPGGDRAQQAGQHRLERRARRRRAQRPRRPERQSAMRAQRPPRPRRSPAPQARRRRMSGSFDSRSLALRHQPVERRADRLDMRRAAIRAASAPSASPSSRATASSASASAGSRCVCRSSIIWTRCSTVRSSAIGVADAVARPPARAARPRPARRARRASPARAAPGRGRRGSAAGPG